MGLRVCVLASGSTGNCTYVGNDDTGILIDGGVSGRVTAERLREIGVDPEQLQALCVTHDHGDHYSCLGVLQRKFNLALYANAGTIEGLDRVPKLQGLEWNVFTTGHAFQIGSLTIEPFRVPHDAYDPVAFIVRDDGGKIGICTDLGLPTSLAQQKLKGCQVVVLETNHDEAMLRDSNRPWSLKQRISGRNGHLSNNQAVTLLEGFLGPHLHTVVMAHLSQDCNTESMAMHTIKEALRLKGYEHVRVELAYADRCSALVETLVPVA